MDKDVAGLIRILRIEVPGPTHENDVTPVRSYLRIFRIFKATPRATCSFRAVRRHRHSLSCSNEPVANEHLTIAAAVNRNQCRIGARERDIATVAADRCPIRTSVLCSSESHRYQLGRAGLPIVEGNIAR